MKINKHIPVKLIKQRHPLAYGSFINWIKLLLENGGIEKNITKALYISLSTLFGIPFRIFENARFGKKIKNLEIKESPILIIGHWRSGTTYLHNLISQDKSLGYISGFQAFAPEVFLGIEKVFKPILSPQEEEHAIANMCSYSFYHGLFFPKNIKKYFRKFVVFDEDSEEIRTKWKEIYIEILKKASFSMRGKRLVLKNPTNTGRIKILLEIFPDAKFIHIYRNPYAVYASTKHLFCTRILREWAFQDISEEELEENILLLYKEIMQRFFEEKNLIPPRNFVEIKYEDLEVNPLEELKRIYNELELPGFEKSKEDFKAYITASQANYKKNKYMLNDETIKKVYQHWKFTIERWKYDVPEDLR